ncbi:hypothetical protein Tco_0298593 [Tanacetum coccineum]
MLSGRGTNTIHQAFELKKLSCIDSIQAVFIAALTFFGSTVLTVNAYMHMHHPIAIEILVKRVERSAITCGWIAKELQTILFIEHSIVNIGHNVAGDVEQFVVFRADTSCNKIWTIVSLEMNLLVSVLCLSVVVLAVRSGRTEVLEQPDSS